jgi:hypothetical protein
MSSGAQAWPAWPRPSPSSTGPRSASRSPSRAWSCPAISGGRTAPGRGDRPSSSSAGTIPPEKRCSWPAGRPPSTAVTIISLSSTPAIAGRSISTRAASGAMTWKSPSPPLSIFSRGCRASTAASPSPVSRSAATSPRGWPPSSRAFAPSYRTRPLIDPAELFSRGARSFLARLPDRLFDSLIERRLRGSAILRNFFRYGGWVRGEDFSSYARIARIDYSAYDLRPFLSRINCPVLSLAGAGSDDHCQLDNLSPAMQVIFDWLGGVLPRLGE